MIDERSRDVLTSRDAQLAVAQRLAPFAKLSRHMDERIDRTGGLGPEHPYAIRTSERATAGAKREALKAFIFGSTK